MAKLFHLTILTPERVFYNGQVEMLKLRSVDGDYSIMADHSPIVMPVVVGTLTIWKPDGMESAFNSEGFMEVDHEGTTVYVQACEKPEEIDSNRAEEAKERAEERLRQRQSMNEYKQSKMALARAMARLQISKRRNIH
jgi:F-type H+-transporting ATPase subunit epsilon